MHLELIPIFACTNIGANYSRIHLQASHGQWSNRPRRLPLRASALEAIVPSPIHHTALGFNQCP